jgi:hypothetical protein
VISNFDKDPIVHVMHLTYPTFPQSYNDTINNISLVNMHIIDPHDLYKQEYLNHKKKIIISSFSKQSFDLLGLHKQETAERKHVVLQASHCRSSSGINSKQTRSPSAAP